MKKHKKIIKILKSIIETMGDGRKKKTTELVESGRRLFNLNEKESALKDLKKALFITPQSDESIYKEQIAYSIAMIYRSMKDDEMEIKYYKISIKNNSSFYKGLFELGKKYLDLGLAKKFNVGSPLRGRWCRLLTNRPRLYAEALHYFKRSIKSESSNPEPHYYTGYTLELLENSKNAIEMFDEVLNLEKSYKNIEKSDLFEKVKNEPKDVKDCCPECKEKIRKDDEFCVGCGHRLKS